MQKKYKNQAERQEAYRARQRAKREAAAEQADEIALCKTLNLCGFAETACDVPAQTWLEEVQIHRSWLRALEQPDVLPGETLRQLAKRTWDALLSSEGLGVSIDNGGVWYPLFSPRQQHFQIPFDSKRFQGGPFGERIRDAAKPEWFDVHWVPPADCSGDEPIDLDLPKSSSNRSEDKQTSGAMCLKVRRQGCLERSDSTGRVSLGSDPRSSQGKRKQYESK
jgi:hypothetical protein